VGAMFPFTIVLWLVSLPFDKDRRVIHTMINLNSFLIVHLIPLWKIKIEGKEKIDKKRTYIIISNHQSILDILAINTLFLRLKWVSKIENLKVPVLGWYLRMADYIVIDRSNPVSRNLFYGKANEFLKRGISIMMFPEGTRSLDRKIHTFKRGAFKLAIDNNVAILPILIDGTGEILPKKGRQLGDGQIIYLKVLDPILPSDFGTTDHDKLALDVFEMMKGQYEKSRKNHIWK
jgi:1-acyl-sn-glycerol-3-phosphate acyltransferase